MENDLSASMVIPEAGLAQASVIQLTLEKYKQRLQKALPWRLLSYCVSWAQKNIWQDFWKASL
jgi:hypothetical protein